MAREIGNGAAAATVDGVPISVDEIQTLMSGVDGGMAPEEALRALIDHEVLAQEAVRRGYGASPEVLEEKRRSLARAVLRRKIADKILPETVDRALLRKAYRNRVDRYNHDEQRQVVHFLAQTGSRGFSDEEALALAQEAYEKLRDSGEYGVFRERAAEIVTEHGAKVKLEDLPPVEADSDKFVRPFVEAIFEIGGEGDVSAPFKTKFGWHVAFLNEIISPERVTFEDVEDDLASEAVPFIRKRQADELLSRLVEDGDVFIVEGLISNDGDAP